jgi:hypothetical protein
VNVALGAGYIRGRLRQDMLHSSLISSLGGSPSREQKEGEHAPLQALERLSPPQQQHRTMEGAAKNLETHVGTAKAVTNRLEVDALVKAVVVAVVEEIPS